MALIKREEIEKREKETLAPYAALSSDSRGRLYVHKEHPLRTAFQRDRDRIIHSTAFRRMEYKTQVFIPHEDDHYRTRLTHSIEVAQIARTLARNLGLNEDLTEAIALVHDLGHTPFGHSGEDVLDELMADYGGFNHNHQSLKIVELLEQRYSDYPGLNLTFEVREGIARHETKVMIKRAEFSEDNRPTLEASLVDMADGLAYSAHDVDDGLSSGLISIRDLKKLSIWENMNELTAKNNDRHQLIRTLIDSLASDLLSETSLRLKLHAFSSHAELRTCHDKLCAYSPLMEDKAMALKKYLFYNLYQHPSLLAMAGRASKIIETLFYKIVNDQALMPSRYRAMLREEKLEIVVSDYIAGMTDRFAENLYGKLK